jgi:hypothetical protein
MLNEVSQVQKDKGDIFSLISGSYTQKINVYINTNMILYTYSMSEVRLLEGTRERERKRE